MNERLQKILAQAGYGSRRQIETFIEEKRISVNKQTAKLGDKIGPDDEVRLDGKVLPITWPDEQACRVIIYHKPEGEICTRSDPEGRPSIFEHLPKIKKARWILIGRLDINTSGLILLTTNGELANRLMHPKQEIEREYAVRVLGELDQNQIHQLKKGVMLEDGFAQFNEIKPQGGSGVNQWYHVIIKEGRKREVRRLFESQNLTVSRLIRIRYGLITLPRHLPRGAWQELSPSQINALAESVELTVRAYEK